MRNLLIRAAHLLTALCILLSRLCTAAAQALPADTPKAAIPDWSKIRAFYEYDAHKPPSVKTEERQNAQAYVLHLEFKGPHGEQVYGLFARPKADGVYPCILLLHGLTANKETMALLFGPSLIQQGIALLALDAPLHGERKEAGAEPLKPENYARILHDGCREYRIALDWLATRKDIDSKRIGMLGYSMGSLMGSILSGVDTRIQAVTLLVGGETVLPLAALAPAERQASAFSLCPSLFIGHIAPRPVLMLNAKRDHLIPEQAAKYLYNAAKEPKEQLWYDSDHLLPKEAQDNAVEWLTAKLRTTKQTAASERKD
jgi:fermentation-respiration switch protein FrsA (DUF1100 family)